MENKPQLKVKLLRQWRPIDDPSALASYVRGPDPEPAVLQFSVAEHKQGSLESVTEETLISLGEKLTQRIEGRKNVSRRSGKCDFGIYGTVMAKGVSPAHFQALVISDGKIFILITHIGTREPAPEEIAEANEIALMTRYD